MKNINEMTLSMSSTDLSARKKLNHYIIITTFRSRADNLFNNRSIDKNIKIVLQTII